MRWKANDLERNTIPVSMIMLIVIDIQMLNKKHLQKKQPLS